MAAMRETKRLVVVAACGAAVIAGAAMSGCAPRARGVEPVVGDGTLGPFRPVSVRVHPLTRVTEGEGGEMELHAHFELLDAWNDDVKALGRVEFTLRPGRTGGSGDAYATEWEVDLNDPGVNSARYDRVTRSYLIRLRGLPSFATSAGSSPELETSFITGDGVRLTARGPVRLPMGE